jgi:hypothetical protein
MQHIYVRNQFRLFLPFQCELVYRPIFDKTDRFGFALQSQNSRFDFHIEVRCLYEDSPEISIAPDDSLQWSKNKAVIPKPSEQENSYEGFVLVLQIPHKNFDFRKIDGSQLVQFQISCFSNGGLVQQAYSPIIQLFPKPRTGIRNDPASKGNLGYKIITLIS